MDENTVQRTASLHEKAVQAVAEGKVGPQHVKARRKPVRRSTPLHKDIKVHEDVWTAARKLLTGSYTRTEIVDSETVIVR